MFVAVPAAVASPFELPPEVGAPRWHTVFPYQRNIDWDFSTDPRSTPPHYEGWDDDWLHVSDFVELTGDVHWYDVVPGESTDGDGQTGTNQDGDYHGVIGLDNREGQETLQGQAIFHIDNWDTPNVKHIWEEYDFVIFDPTFAGSSIIQDLDRGGSSLEGIEVVSLGQISTEPKLYRQDIWYELIPNPPYEAKIVTFTAAAGTMVIFDRLHIATECVPEPATMSLLAMGVLPVGSLLRRRLRRR